MTRLNPNDQAPAGQLLDIDSNEITLDDALWAQGPTVLTFLRHFG